MALRDEFDSISPVDYRYWDKDVADYLSENAFTKYKCAVEVALLRALCKRGLCSQEIVTEVAAACDKITTDEVYDEEERTRHDIRALVNCIQRKVSPEARPFVHMTATSFDISDTANAARFKACMKDIVLPCLEKLQLTLADLSKREAATVQIGRTHGQHAVPITFGFAVAGYVSRLGSCIVSLEKLSNGLVGKFAGAVGAYNASHLFFEDPEAFEWEVLAELHLNPGEHSTQIVQPEPLLRLLYECVLGAGILANLADDMRHLQRTEISEIGEGFGANQVGSSTMPQKRNPINFENAKSMWKIIVSRIMAALLDQISEHQRDLTNSASARTYGESLCYLVATAKRLTRVMNKMQVDHASMHRNLSLQGDLIAAEPLYLLLALYGHPDAHEASRRAAQSARGNETSLSEAITADEELVDYWSRFSEKQRNIIRQPHLYVGIAAAKALAISDRWINQLRV